MDALILAGAVAKGAFEAGAIQGLVENGVRFKRIVGTSAGALNGCLFAAGVYAGKPKAAADLLVRLWRQDAEWKRVFSLSLKEIFARRGLSTSDKVIELLKKNARSLLPGHRHDVELRLVTTALHGVPRKGPVRFESVLRFSGLDFERRPDEIFIGAAASAAFPVAFAPVEVATLDTGLCLDGGLVNNTPVKHALHDDSQGSEPIDRIFVVVPQPIKIQAPQPLRGVSLASHLSDVIVHERLYRDLRDAEWVNQALRGLQNCSLGKDALKRVKAAIGLADARVVQIIQVRPRVALEGSAFSGFSSADLRNKYIALGYKAAHEAFKTLGSPGSTPASSDDREAA